MEPDKATRVIGAVALALSVATLVAHLAQSVVAAGLLGWMLPPQLFHVLAFAVPNLLFGLAGLTLLLVRRPAWRTVALTFVGVAGLLQLGVVAFMLQVSVYTGWTKLLVGSDALRLLVGLAALVVLARSSRRPASAAPLRAARVVALLGAIAIAVGVLFLPHFVDTDGRGVGSVLSHFEVAPSSPRVWTSLVTGALVPVLAVAAAAGVRQRAVWTGAVAAIAANYWSSAIQVVADRNPVPGNEVGPGIYLITAGFLALVAALVMDRRATDGLDLTASDPEDPRDRDRATVDA